MLLRSYYANYYRLSDPTITRMHTLWDMGNGLVLDKPILYSDQATALLWSMKSTWKTAISYNSNKISNITYQSSLSLIIAVCALR